MVSLGQRGASTGAGDGGSPPFYGRMLSVPGTYTVATLLDAVHPLERG